MTQRRRYLAVFFFSLACSIGGIPIAAFVSKKAADGGRGGAIGASIALLFLFVSRDYGTELYAALTKELPELKGRIDRIKAKTTEPVVGELTGEARVSKLEERVTKLEAETGTLVNRIDIDAGGQRVQSQYLAWATFVGTIAWGFGDLLAQCLMKHFSSTAH